MRTMFDSNRPSAIPADAQMVMGYVDGIYAWSRADWNRFRDAVKVRCSAVGATHLADVFDVEPGCIWPPENVVPLVVAARKAGIDPTVYCNRRNHWGAVRAAFDAAGVPQPHYLVSEYDGVAEIPPGSVGKQYKAPEAPGVAQSPGHYDVSAVADYWPGVDGDDMTPEELVGFKLYGRRRNDNDPRGYDEYQVDVGTLLLDVHTALYQGHGYNLSWGPGVLPRLAELQAKEGGVVADIDYDVLADKVAARVGDAIADKVADKIANRMVS